MANLPSAAAAVTAVPTIAHLTAVIPCPAHPQQAGPDAVAQNSPRTPPRVIVASCRGSAVSNMTNSVTIAATPKTNNKRPPPDPIDEDPPLPPAKRYPDFSVPPSRDDADLSGDDCEGWENERDSFEAVCSKQNSDERREANNMRNDVPEMQE